MFDIEKTELLNVLEGPSALSGSFASRPSHALVFKLSGESVYRFEDRCLCLRAGEVLYIPQGAAYSFGKISSGESRYILINFRGQVSRTVPEKYGVAQYMDFSYFCHQLKIAGLMESRGDKYKVLSLFYQALECMSQSENTAYLQDYTAQRLESAVTYLQAHLYDPELKIGQLHSLCGVSDTYFRKLFLARFGVSPKRYILQRRLTRAKALLDHGEYNSIGEVAQLSGFEDALYFSKVFRKTYGCPPSENR